MPETAEEGTDRVTMVVITGLSGAGKSEAIAAFEDAGSYMLLAPAATPRLIVERFANEVTRILNLPELKERLAGEGAAVVASTPEQFAAFLRNEIATTAKIVKASGMTATN